MPTRYLSQVVSVRTLYILSGRPRAGLAEAQTVWCMSRGCQKSHNASVSVIGGVVCRNS